VTFVFFFVIFVVIFHPINFCAEHSCVFTFSARIFLSAILTPELVCSAER